MANSAKETGKKGDLVFISYAESDQHIADMIYSALESIGIRGWVAHRDIDAGMDWTDEISKAISQSKIFIGVISSNTENSPYVKDEVTLARDENKRIIPFYIENVSLQRGLRLLLSSYQRIYAFPKSLEMYLDELCEIVLRHLGKEPVIPIKIEKLKEKTKEPADMPEDVKKVISKAHKVDKNKNGYWEAYYQEYDITMVYIPPSKFMMGSDNGDDREKPAHEVDMDGYWIGKYEVTFAQYDQYCVETKKEKPNANGWGREKRPAINVSWNDAVSYCEWLSMKLGLIFKLPTEAQWEKAARGSDQRRYPWGSKEPNIDLANFIRNIGKTTPVGSYPEGASPYGLMDMAGNVWEWCSDWYNPDYYKNSPSNNPPGPASDSKRVQRSGSWKNDIGYLRCAFRGQGTPSLCFDHVGFRLCQDNQ